MRIVLVTLALALFSAPQALAACANPVGAEGDMVYSATCKTPQYCDGTSWVAMSDTSSCTPNACTTDGLVGYWAFDESAGTLAPDTSGASKHGTLTNLDPATDWVSGKRGNAIKIDGIDGHVLAPKPNLTSQNFSVSFWVYLTNGANNQAMFSRLFGEQFYPRFWVDGNPGVIFDLMFQMRIGGSTQTADMSSAPENLALNEWTHYVVMMDHDGGNILTMYRNGTYQYTNDMLDGVMDTGANPLTIGGTAGSDAFAGSIDEFRVYNRVLSEAEIIGLYGGGHGCIP